MFRKNNIITLLLILFISGSCQVPDKQPVILVSKEYGNIMLNWLSRVDNTILRINMYNVADDSIAFWLSKADGFIISGGPDVNPDIYGKVSELERCGSIDHRRDTLELKMIRYAIENDIPLLGICRGNQIINVANKGTLIIDIPTDHDTIITHRQEGKHMVALVEGTFLSEIIGQDSGLINSRHHQAIEMIAPGFRASAFAPDGIIEAIELVDRTEHPFLMGIQWHPESMILESDSPFTLSIAIRYMEAVFERMK